MNIEEIMEQIKKQKQYMNEDVSTLNPATINAKLGRKRQAKDRLEELAPQYKRSLAPLLSFIVVAGSEAKKFADVVTQETETAVLDAESFYKALANKVPPQLINGRESTSVIINSLREGLIDIAKEMGLYEINNISYRSQLQTPIKTKQDVLNLTKRVVNEQVGAEIAALYLLNGAAKNAMDAEFSGKIFPVLVYLEDSSITKEFLFGLSKVSPKTFTIKAGTLSNGSNLEGTVDSLEAVDKDSVMAALKKVKTALTKSKPSSKVKKGE